MDNPYRSIIPAETIRQFRMMDILADAHDRILLWDWHVSDPDDGEDTG